MKSYCYSALRSESVVWLIFGGNRISIYTPILSGSQSGTVVRLHFLSPRKVHEEADQRHVAALRCAVNVLVGCMHGRQSCWCEIDGLLLGGLDCCLDSHYERAEPRPVWFNFGTTYQKCLVRSVTIELGQMMQLEHVVNSKKTYVLKLGLFDMIL